MDGYYIAYNTTDDNNYAVSRILREEGVFIDKEMAQKIVDKLNLPFKKAWEQRIKDEKIRVELAQKRWDLLEPFGLQSGQRPELSTWAKETEWKPDNNYGYFSVEDGIEIHGIKSAQEFTIQEKNK